MDGESKTAKTKRNFTQAHGRRKEAVARVRLFKGKGENTVNAKPIMDYFPGTVFTSKLERPFNLTKTEGQYYITVKVDGSGKSGQLDATIHGISRALISENPDFRTILKRAGLLTRDPRIKERRKYGRAQKARKGKQSPKR